MPPKVADFWGHFKVRYTLFLFGGPLHLHYSQAFIPPSLLLPDQDNCFALSFSHAALCYGHRRFFQRYPALYRYLKPFF